MELMIEGITPMHTTFETGKEKIRNAISDIAERATSFEEFQTIAESRIRNFGKRPSWTIQLSAC